MNLKDARMLAGIISGAGIGDHGAGTAMVENLVEMLNDVFPFVWQSTGEPIYDDQANAIGIRVTVAALVRSGARTSHDLA